MSDKLELHGWTDLVIPTEAMIGLSSRAFKLLSYYVFRQRNKDGCVPGIRRIGEDLTTEDEKWSDSTIKRANEELTAKKWIVRTRRGVGKNSETHVFHSLSDYEEWQSCQTTDDPTVSSPVTRQSAHLWSDSKNTQKKEYTKENDSASEPEKKPRPQDLIFEAVAKGSFGISNMNTINGDGGRIAMVSSWLKKNVENITVEEVQAFYDWWELEHDSISPPRDLNKFQEHWAMFKSRKTAGQADLDGYNSRKRV